MSVSVIFFQYNLCFSFVHLFVIVFHFTALAVECFSFQGAIYSKFVCCFVCLFLLIFFQYNLCFSFVHLFVIVFHVTALAVECFSFQRDTKYTLNLFIFLSLSFLVFISYLLFCLFKTFAVSLIHKDRLFLKVISMYFFSLC